jgi:hypothetical protein
VKVVKEKILKPVARIFPEALRVELVRAGRKCVRAAGDRAWRGMPPEDYVTAALDRDMALNKIREARPEMFR